MSNINSNQTYTGSVCTPSAGGLDKRGSHIPAAPGTRTWVVNSCPALLRGLPGGRGISLEIAKAYASTDSQDKQLLVWNNYSGHS